MIDQTTQCLMTIMNVQLSATHNKTNANEYVEKFYNNYRGVDTPLFLWYDIPSADINMDRGKLKNIVKSLQSLLDVLESEVYSDVNAYNANQDNSTYTQGRDDDDGYPD